MRRKVGRGEALSYLWPPSPTAHLNPLLVFLPAPPHPPPQGRLGNTEGAVLCKMKLQPSSEKAGASGGSGSGSGSWKVLYKKGDKFLQVGGGVNAGW